MTRYGQKLSFAFISIALTLTVLPASAKTIATLKAAVIDSTQVTTNSTPSPLERKDVNAFIDHMVKKFQFSRKKLRTAFAKVHLRPRIIKTIHNPKEATPWFKYKHIFLTTKRIDAGVVFWQKHEGKLAQAEKKYGVPAHIILGILGVETFYGTRAGTHSALDALATLAFNYPERSKFFTSELEALFLLSREQHFDPLVLKSSYAGALGYPQFMPSSYRDYAIDFSSDGVADLLGNPEDAIGSVANYLSKKGGWRSSQPIAERAKLTHEVLLPNEKTKNIATLEQLAKKGIVPTRSIAKSTKARAFQIQEKDELQTWLGFNNFKAILRYNPRINYAMAVMNLGEAIQNAKQKKARENHATISKT